MWTTRTFRATQDAAALVQKGDTEIVFIHMYGHVGLGLTGANIEMVQQIGRATDGGRRFVIAVGDTNVTAEALEASGLLEEAGLTLIRPNNVNMTCTSGKGSMIDYALVTTSFAAAIVSVEAVTEVPWGPHFGLRVKYRTNTSDIMVPEIVRPMDVAKAVEEMEEKGWVEENPGGQPSISWEEARNMTQEMVEDCLSYPNGAVTEYTDMLEITEQTRNATRQYAEWSAATEIRHYSSLGSELRI